MTLTWTGCFFLKVVDDVPFSGGTSVIDDLIGIVEVLVLVRTVAHGAGLIRFFGLNFVQHDDKSISVDADGMIRHPLSTPLRAKAFHLLLVLLGGWELPPTRFVQYLAAVCSSLHHALQLHRLLHSTMHFSYSKLLAPQPDNRIERTNWITRWPFLLVQMPARWLRCRIFCLSLYFLSIVSKVVLFSHPVLVPTLLSATC